MIERLFLRHPRTVGESYLEHAATALRFGGAMMLGGAACVVHAIVPALFTRTASSTVKTLHMQLRARQPGFAAHAPLFSDTGWQPEYEI